MSTYSSGINTADADLISCAAKSNETLRLAEKIAKVSVPVLIYGESGTGKECVARYIHRQQFGTLTAAPYIGVNCAAIPDSLLEATLFGYEKGAFTGAVQAMPGKFEQANGGTLLLDEIGDMPLSLQVKLLRVLQEQEVERLGSTRRIKLNVRVIAATHQDIPLAVKEGRFRQDLYYRLAVLPITIAPLRERPEDILPLVNHFMQKYRAFATTPLSIPAYVNHALVSYEWPGNVRELENKVQRGMILCQGDTLTIEDLGLPATHISFNTLPRLPDATSGIRQMGKQVEQQYVLDVLKQFNGNKTLTAEKLGITPRALRYRLSSMRQAGLYR
ncbi:sigma-54-dependent Fis family transcriptional regulator [Rosenbergiella collisarenosi]|uniref:sigma-54 interaction domain-containing protein n=1 Tax=Rosenbergiella collisarenosi TaxID=1544695 RepID=UPI001BD94982|nr:sigma-54 dependent transcriptional regulator [Rosenbergiella collisarenosi]MBT0721902.1 sigma-54-dependent Fis family transcriptional regulator [Rosenbergiella collisarenosi]